LVDAQTLLETFLDMSLRYACYISEVFLIKSKTSSLEITLLKCQIIWVSKLLDIGLKEFCCIKIPLS